MTYPGSIADGFEALGLQADEIARKYESGKIYDSIVRAIEKSRREPGLSLKDVAQAITAVLSIEESDALIVEIAKYTRMKIQNGN